MSGTTEAILQFLTLLNSAGIPQKFKEAFDKRTAEDKQLHENVAKMKDAPPPNTGEPNA